MKVAAIQHDIAWEDPDSTRKQVAPLIADAAGQGARLIALTEMYATGFSMHPERIAEDEGGPNEQFLLDQAARHDAWLIASIAQNSRSGRPRNVAVLAGPDGRVHRYAKIHPFSYAREDEKYDAGTETLTVEIDGLRVSPFICYDLRFADGFWALARSTDLYVVVANWPESRGFHWRHLLTARAIENQAFVLGVNRVGTVKRDVYHGDSAIIDPMGRTLATASRREAVLVADVTAAEVASVRAEFPFLDDRTPGNRPNPNGDHTGS
jgi:predicted amidohydrolase